MFLLWECHLLVVFFFSSRLSLTKLGDFLAQIFWWWYFCPDLHIVIFWQESMTHFIQTCKMHPNHVLIVKNPSGLFTHTVGVIVMNFMV